MEDLGIENLFGSIYKNRRVLLTGHTGFKGSWLALWLNQLGARVAGFSLPPNTNPSHFSILDLKLESHIGDINIQEHLLKIMSDFKPEIVFHLAAQPIVLESFSNPHYTFRTNIIGTVNLLESCRKIKTIKSIVVITSDKVYENIESEYSYNEFDRLGGTDPYSASKACVEIVCNSYRKSYFKDSDTFVTTARAGNVIGGGDWADYRLVPDIVKSIYASQPLIIRNPGAIRPWQHVLEPLSGYLHLGRKLLEGRQEFADAWNFGPESGNCIPVSDLIDLIRGQWNEIKVEIVQSEYHEASLLMLDCSKAKKYLNWEPVWDIEETTLNTIDWYKRFYLLNEVQTLSNLHQYIADARKKRLIWTEA
jgi:CDP-glucose 4,6-dehydratase